MKNIFSFTMEKLHEISIEIINILTSLNATKHEIHDALLLLEEITVRLNENNQQDVTIQVKKFLGDISIIVRSHGEAYNPFESVSSLDVGTEDYIRDIILRAYKQDLSYSRHNSQNVICICVHHAGNRKIYFTITLMLAGILFGLLMKHLPPVASDMLSDTIFAAVQKIFMNALSILLAPVVFFSITSSFASLSGGSEIGKLASKTMLFFAATTAFAIIIGIGCGHLFLHKDDLPVIPMLSQSSSVPQTAVEISLFSILTGLVPKDIIAPLQTLNILQIFICSVCVGCAMSLLGEKVSHLRVLCDEANSLLSKIMGMIVSWMPLIAFSAMATLVYKNTLSSLTLIVSYVIAVVVSCFVMYCLFALMILLFAHKSFIPYLKNMPSFFVTPFVCPKRNAILPVTLDFCTNKLNASEKSSAFVLSFGATIHKSAVAMCIILEVILFANICGITLSAYMLFKLSAMTFFLSFGSNGLVCLMAVLPIANIPVSPIVLVIGVEAIVDRLRTVTNISGDIAATLVVAKD